MTQTHINKIMHHTTVECFQYFVEFTTITKIGKNSTLK